MMDAATLRPFGKLRINLAQGDTQAVGPIMFRGWWMRIKRKGQKSAVS
jgi:hypothetical protein